MKLILSVDAIHKPITGIGRYALELATRLPSTNSVEDLRYFSLGQWRTDNFSAFLSPAKEYASPPPRDSLLQLARKKLATSSVAVKLYARLFPYIESHRLSPFSDYVFHSPNYILPRFEGKKIVTIPDLSIFHYPQYHPAARVSLLQQKIPDAIERSDRIITISEFIADEIERQYGVHREKITVTPLGVNEIYSPKSGQDLIDTLHKYNLSPQTYFLSVATLEPRKNLQGLIQAYRKLDTTSRKRFPLVLSGNCGWNNSNLLEEIRKASTEGWLKMIGYVEEQDLPYLFSGATGFVYPSFYEGFGLPILEAFACGTPVVTSANSAITELAENSAALIDPNDVHAISEAIRSVIESDTAWKTRTENATKVARHLTWDHCVEKTLDAYQNV